MNKKIFTITILFPIILLISCQKRSLPFILVHAEKLLMINPDSAYHLLSRVENQMKEEPESAQMYYQLILFRARDLCYIPHKNSFIISRVIDYYHKKEDDDHLMQAYYCMGCIYRDWHDAPHALSYYQRALDISGKSNNYSIIARIYNQIGQLEFDGYGHELAMSSFKKAFVYFKRSNDSLTIPYAIVDIGKTYEMQNNDKMALIYYLWGYNIAKKQINKSRMAAISLDLAALYMNLNMHEKARYFLNSSFNSHAIKYSQNWASYYINKGMLYSSDNKLDSAVYFFKHGASIGDTFSKEASYNALYQIYKYRSNMSEALKYSELYNKMMDINRDNSHAKEMIRMQSLYNYDRTERKNQQLVIDNQRKERTIAELVALIFILFVIILFYRQRNIKKRNQRNKSISELTKQYKESQEFIDKNNNEIELLKRQLVENMNNMTESHIAALEMNNAKALNSIQDNERIWKSFRRSQIYFTIHSMVEVGDLKCSYSELDDYLKKLKDTIDLYFDHFGQRLLAYYPLITSTEMTLCYLIKAEVQLINMSVFLSLSKQSITNIRSRMNKKCFEGAKTTKEFDLFIHDF